MSDDVDLPIESPGTDTPATENVVSNAIDIAFQREADREAGKTVPDVLPDAGKPRDEHGKFTKPKGAPVPAAPVATQAPASDQAKAPVAPATQVLPNDWNDAQKQTFAGLNPDAQKLILDQKQRQDADYTRKTQEVAETRRTYEPLVQSLAPHVDYLNRVSSQLGQTAPAMLSNLVQFERTLRTSDQTTRAAALAQLIREYPVPLDVLNRALGQPQAQVPDAFANQFRQTQQQVQDLQARLRQQDIDRETQAAQSLVENARTAKDESGQLKYPHFDAVRGLMHSLVLQGATFDDAYKTAAAPIEAIASQRTQAAGAADKARAAAVARAKGAASPRTNGTVPGGSLSNVSMDARVSSILDQVGIV